MGTATRQDRAVTEVRRARAARIYLWAWGAALVVLGAGSLIVHPHFGLGAEVTDRHLFGVFETNGWHGLAGLAAGAFGLAFARSDRWAAAAAAGLGAAGGVVPALIFFVVGDGGVALAAIPVDIADAVTLHLIPGLIGVACAWRSRP